MFFGPRARRRLPLTLLFLLLGASQLTPLTAVVHHVRAATLSTSSGNNGTIKIAESPAYDEPPAGGSNEPHVTCPFWIQGYKFPVSSGTLSVTVQAPAVSPQTVGQVIIDNQPWSGTHQNGGYFFNMPDNLQTGYGWADGFVSGGHYEVDVSDARNDKNKVFFDVTCAAPPTDTPTNTPTATATDTPTNTPTATATDTPTDTPTATATDAPTNTPTATATGTPVIRYVTLPAPSPITVVHDMPAPTATPAPTYTPLPTYTPAPTSTPLPTYTPAPTSTPFSQDAPVKVVTKIRYRTVIRPKYREITRTTTRVKVRQVVKTVVRYRTVTQVKHVTRVRTVVHHKLVYQTKVRYVTRVRYQTKVVTRDRMVTRVVTQYHYVQHPKTGRFAAPIAVRSSSIIPSVIPAAGARMSIARLGLSWLPVWSRDYIADVNGNLLYDIVPATGVTRFAPSAGFGRNGLTLVMGHDDEFGSVFRNLSSMRKGDLVSVWQGHHEYRYTVSSVQIVAPDDVSQLNAPRSRPTLALVTCTPFMVDTHRVVVIAQMR